MALTLLDDIDDRIDADLEDRWARIVNELTRRGFLTGGIGAAALLGLSACGSNDHQGGATSSAVESGYPVTVEGKEGTAQVDAPPTRVVAVGYLRDTDLALALGANLVGLVKNSNFSSGIAPWQKLAGKPALLDATGGMPFEKIAELRPDLILAADDFTLATDYANLAKIAPTLSYRTSAGQDDWETMTDRAGLVLGRAEKARQLARSVAAQIAKAKAAHPQFAGKTFTSGLVTGPSQFYVNNSVSAAPPFYTLLGFHLATAVTRLPSTKTAGRALISAERLDVLEADVMILTFASSEVQKQVESSALFQRLNAVQRGSYIALDLTTATALGFPSVLSIPYGLKATLPKLSAAVAAIRTG